MARDLEKRRASYRAHNQRRYADPAFRAEKIARSKDRYQQIKADRAALAVYREKHRIWKRNWKKDPAVRERINERRRIRRREDMDFRERDRLSREKCRLKNGKKHNATRRAKAKAQEAAARKIRLAKAAHLAAVAALRAHEKVEYGITRKEAA